MSDIKNKVIELYKKYKDLYIPMSQQEEKELIDVIEKLFTILDNGSKTVRLNNGKLLYLSDIDGEPLELEEIL